VEDNTTGTKAVCTGPSRLCRSKVTPPNRDTVEYLDLWHRIHDRSMLELTVSVPADS